MAYHAYEIKGYAEFNTWDMGFCYSKLEADRYCMDCAMQYRYQELLGKANGERIPRRVFRVSAGIPCQTVPYLSSNKGGYLLQYHDESEELGSSLTKESR